MGKSERIGDRVESYHLPQEISIEEAIYEENGKGGAREEQKKYGMNKE
jgi:hypothetical protein